jgi:restriction endonuclease S subunit
MKAQAIKFRWLISEYDVRSTESTRYPLMSVSQHLGVIPRSELKGDEGRAESIDNYKTSKPGQIVLNRMSAASGALGIASEHGLVSPDYAVLQPSEFVEPKFLYYLMKSDWFIGQMVARLKGIGAGGEGASVRTPRVNISDLGDIDVNLPSIEEQRRIAEYLDEQVQSLRKIIAKKESLLNSMSQERLTKISALVTNGFNREKTNIGSEIDDWIFSKPKEWKLLPLKHLVSVDNSGVWGEEPGVLDYDIPIATTAHLTRTNTFLFDQMPIRSLELRDLKKYVCRSGDLVVVKSSGSSDNIMSGKVCVVGEDAPTFAFSNFLMKLRPFDIKLSRFLQAFLSSHIGVERVKRMVSVTTYPNLRVEEYMNSLVPVPPESEIERLDRTIAGIENCYASLIEKIEKSIELLKLYESSLITVFVTGVNQIVDKGGADES